jgi:hypothetical protein
MTEFLYQRRDLMFFIDTSDNHHGHEDVHFIDMARIASEKRFNVIRLIGLDNEIHPSAWNVYPWQLPGDLVDLNDDDPLAESRSLNDGGRVFGVRPGKDVSQRQLHADLFFRRHDWQIVGACSGSYGERSNGEIEALE